MFTEHLLLPLFSLCSFSSCKANHTQPCTTCWIAYSPIWSHTWTKGTVTAPPSNPKSPMDFLVYVYTPQALPILIPQFSVSIVIVPLYSQRGSSDYSGHLIWTLRVLVPLLPTRIAGRDSVSPLSMLTLTKSQTLPKAVSTAFGAIVTLVELTLLLHFTGCTICFARIIAGASYTAVTCTAVIFPRPGP